MTAKQHIILAFEASAGAASAALMADGEILAEAQHEASHGHGAWMVGLAEECITQAGVKKSAITTVLGGRGPGSFTGVRVALAAAKGFALARGIAGYGIGSLTALAHCHDEGGGAAAGGGVAVLGDTRRKGLVFLEFSGGAANDGGAEILTPAEAIEAITARGIGKVIGNVDLDAPGIEVVKAEPLARHLCRLFADGGYDTKGNAAKIMPLEPFYLTAPLLGPR